VIAINDTIVVLPIGYRYLVRKLDQEKVYAIRIPSLKGGLRLFDPNRLSQVDEHTWQERLDSVCNNEV
jgi:hypothetical protein